MFAEDKKQNLFVATIIVVAVIVIMGFLIFFFVDFGEFFKAKPIEKPKVKNELELQQQAADIIRSKDFNRCQEIKDEVYQKVCINNIALNLAEEKQDISYCQKIDGQLIPIEECEREIIFQKAIDEGKTDACEETNNQGLQQECKENFWSDSAVKKSDIALCNNVEGEQGKNVCRDNYVFAKEYQVNAASFDCDRFNEENLRQYCEASKQGPSVPQESFGAAPGPIAPLQQMQGFRF